MREHVLSLQARQRIPTALVRETGPSAGAATIPAAALLHQLAGAAGAVLISAYTIGFEPRARQHGARATRSAQRKEAETQMKAFVVSTYGENGLPLADERSPGLALPSQRPEPEAVG